VVGFIQVVLGYLSSLEQLAVSDNTYKKVHDLQVHKEGLLTFVIANLFGYAVMHARTHTQEAKTWELFFSNNAHGETYVNTCARVISYRHAHVQSCVCSQVHVCISNQE
jgi:hypothetical protein